MQEELLWGILDCKALVIILFVLKDFFKDVI